MGKGGLELYKIHPQKLSENILNEIILKSMPMGAKKGDFTTVSLSDGRVISGYLFTTPDKLGRDNIASLIVIFESLKYNAEIIKRNFASMLSTLANYDLVTLELIADLLPIIFDSFSKRKGKIKVNSDVSIDYDFTSLNLSRKKDKIKDFTDDIWG